jgi:hypothetical protein
VPENWEVRRAWLNHDWLAKIYASKLGAWRNVIEGLVQSERFVERFINHDFAEWERRRDALSALIDDFSVDMSPRVLLNRPPLDRLDDPTRAWLGELVERQWQARCDIPSLVQQARDAFVRADTLYWPLKELLAATTAGDPAIAVLDFEAARFAAFQQACADLSTALSLFPHEISIV